MKYILIVNEKRLNEFRMVHPTTWTYDRNFTWFDYSQIQFPCVALIDENKISKVFFDRNSTIRFDGFVSLDGYIEWKSGFLFNGKAKLDNHLAYKNKLSNGSVVFSSEQTVEMLRKMHEETVLFSTEKEVEKLRKKQRREDISKYTERLLSSPHLKMITPSENEYIKDVLMGAADLDVTIPKIPLSKPFVKVNLNMTPFLESLKRASDLAEALKAELKNLTSRRKKMKKNIPLPNLVTSDGQQQFLTKKGDNYFASRRDRSLKQVFNQEEFELIPDLYKSLAKDAEDEFRLEIVPGSWLYVYEGDYGITVNKNGAAVFSESDIEVLKNNPDLHIDFETALVRMID